jgi:hypothetical protein
MEMRYWKTSLAAGAFLFLGALASTSLPVKASIFLEGFESSSRAGNKVSVLERVYYSLIQVNEREQQEDRSKQDESCFRMRAAL